MQKKITMMITENEHVIDIAGNVDVVTDPDDFDVHVADIVYSTVLEECLTQDAGLLDPGKKYNVKLLALVTSITED
jgi:isocitrate/isopropylmalate dehydrogenase